VKVFVESNTTLPLVAITLTFRVGSVNDPIGKEGLARFVARMARRGAAGKSATELQRTIDSLGADFSSDVGFSTTTFSIEAIRRNLPAVIELIASMLGSPTFADDEIEQLRGEIKSELIEARDNDRGLAGRALRQRLFNDHPYGRPISGRRSSVDGFTRQEVVDFYAKHYGQAHAILAISGHITEVDAHAVAAQLLSNLPQGELLPDSVPDAEPAPPAIQLIVVDKPDRTQTQMYIGTLGTHPRENHFLPLHVSTTVFGGTFTSRLMNEVRSKRGWSYGAYARIGFDRHRDAFTMWTAPAAKDAPDCLRLQLDLLRKWQEKGISQSELAFTKKYLCRSHVFELDTPHKRIVRQMETAIYDLPTDYHATYLPRIKQVSKEAADMAVRERINPNNLVIAVVGTSAEIGKALEDAVGGNVVATTVPWDAE